MQPSANTMGHQCSELPGIDALTNQMTAVQRYMLPHVMLLALSLCAFCPSIAAEEKNWWWPEFSGGGGAALQYWVVDPSGNTMSPPWGDYASHGSITSGGYTGTGYFSAVRASKVAEHTVHVGINNNFTAGEVRFFKLLLCVRSPGPVPITEYAVNKVIGTRTSSGYGSHWLCFRVVGGGPIKLVCGDKDPTGDQADGCIGCEQNPVLNGPTAANAPIQVGVPNLTSDPVRYADGEMDMYEDDLEPLSGSSLSVRRSYSNLSQQIEGDFGSAWMGNGAYRIARSGDYFILTFRANQVITYVLQAGPTFTPLRPHRAVLSQAADGKLVYADPSGGTFVFYGMNDSTVTLRGRMYRLYTQSGDPIQYYYDSTGALERVERATGDGQREVIAYQRDVAQGRIVHAERRRIAGSATTVVQQVDYGYYTGAVSDFGETGGLKQVVVKTGPGLIQRRFHYRYYRSSEVVGVPGLLKVAVGPRNYERLVASGVDPLSVETAQLLPGGAMSGMVDKYFEYDDSARVTRQVMHGDEVDASGDYTYSYYNRPGAPASPGPNDWMVKTTETLPDGSQNIVFTNKAAAVLLKATVPAAGTDRWVHGYRYDAAWHLTWHITPAAMQQVSGAWYSEANADLLGFGGGNSPYVKDNEGLIERWIYYSSVGLSNYIQYEERQVGELGTPTMVKAYTYTNQGR